MTDTFEVTLRIPVLTKIKNKEAADQGPDEGQEPGDITFGSIHSSEATVFLYKHMKNVFPELEYNTGF